MGGGTLGMAGAADSRAQSQSEDSAGDHSQLISWRSVATFWRAMTASKSELSAHDAAATLFRFFRSEHVLDLKLIFTLTAFLFCIHVLSVVAFALIPPTYHLFSHILPYLLAHLSERLATSPFTLNDEGTLLLHGVEKFIALYVHGFEVLADIPKALVTYFCPAIPLYGGIVAWAYLSAATRLGVVDLFACEIRTVCRVGTAFDIGKAYIAKRKNLLDEAHRVSVEADRDDGPKNITVEKPSPESKGFVSQEDYFPVFGSNSHDLEALEALVVGNITEFYTYMKVTHDLQRKLAEAASSQESAAVLENLIYVLFLAYESGRKAITELIEFEPTRAENIIIILITELECYSFLCKHFTDRNDELRFSRLKLREAGYKRIVSKLISDAKAPHGSNDQYWVPAQRTIPELRRRYDVVQKTLRECAKRAPRSVRLRPHHGARSSKATASAAAS
jgi:hypothetical protein